MPWSEKQRRAIYLSVVRKKGKAAASRLMHKHGYGGKKKRRSRGAMNGTGAHARSKKGGK